MNTTHGYVRVAAASPRVKVGAVGANTDAALALARQAEEDSCDVVVFPELCLTAYTCGDLFHQRALLDAAEEGLARFLDETREFMAVCALGAPVRLDGQLFNCAVAVQSGRILAIVPKSYVPGYNEYYEPRWFAPADAARSKETRLAGQHAPFGCDLLLQAEKTPGFRVGLELCEDLWAPIPPSSHQALAGATVLLNLSASNDLVGKHDYRRSLVAQQSARCLAAYAYSSAGIGESTTDLVFGGHAILAENGAILAERERFRPGGELTFADVDLDFLQHERMENITFSRGIAREFTVPSGATAPSRPAYRQVTFRPRHSAEPPLPLARAVEAYPFVPAEAARRKERCREIFAIQSTGLATRLQHTGCKDLVIGLSGGLDSTLALLVSVEALHRAGLERSGVHCLTMPGFGTTDRTRGNAERLCSSLALELTTIDIRESCRLHLSDIGHDGESADITFENAQARERTQILMDKANMLGALVVGTGDLSEMALGWCTYNGDHMSMYAVNVGVPKTLVKYLISYVADERVATDVADVLQDILDTPITPELLPPDENGEIAQKTEDVVGPYELHDFFLYQAVRCGFSPDKVLYLARQAFPVERYPDSTLATWLQVFYRRFFSQQFKRSCIPDGPKVGTVALSPRGDWRMPSDASPDEWLARLP